VREVTSVVSYSDFRLTAELQGVVSVVLTGGAAVQLFTRDEFLTGDIDIALTEGESHDKVAKALEHFGLQNMGNIWLDEKGHRIVQVVGYYYGPKKEVEYGDLTIRTVGLEYLIADRLSKCSHGLSKGCEQALVLLEGYWGELDTSYLRELLKQFEVDESFLDKSKLMRLSSRKGKSGIKN
jgi:hypothetical protein